AFAATWQGDRPAAAQAVDHARAALAAADQADPRRAWLAYLEALGAYYAGDVAAAQVRFDALAETSHGTLRAAALAGQGLVAHRRGDLAAARERYAAAEALAQAVGDHARALNMAMNVAVADHERGDLGAAWSGYGRVVQAAAAAGNQGVAARARNNRGNLLATLGMDRAAADDLQATLGFWSEAGNAHLLGNVRCLLGEIARRQGDLAAAHDHLSAADEALSGAGAATERAEIQLERGYLALAQGDLALADELAESVRTAATRHGSSELQGRALALQAAIALDGAPYLSPDAPRTQTALAAARTALDLLPETKVLHRCAAATLYARALLASGQWAAGRTLALDHLGLLGRTAASLPGAVRGQFDHAAAVRDVRLVLRVVADAAAPLLSTPAGAQARLPLLDAVLSLNRRLGAQRDVGPLLEAVMDAAVGLTGAERGFLLIDDGELGAAPEDRAGRLRVAVARNLDRENLRRPQHKLSHTVAERVFVEGEAVLTTDAQADARFSAQASVHAGSLRSILCVPLHTPEGVLGAIYVDNRFAAGAFTAEHAALAAALADQAAIAIQTARLVEKQRQTAVDLERSRAQVEALNAQLKAQLADVSTQLHDARADLQAQRLAIARRSDYSRIIGESPQMHRLFSLMDRVRDHAFPVLIVGESGTGKELVARAIHFTGARARGPFVAVNCGALPSNLLESELFGHTKGAFTGAVSDRRGLFEAASGGTLLLDEVGEMPLEMQVKLLRVLQTGEVTRVGESGVRKVDTRVLAATHRDLPAMVRSGAFREDLLYRLRVVELQIPPLRSRPTDIAALVEQFIAENRKQRIGEVTAVSPAALARLCQAPWPGNVRQLETLLKSACLFAHGAMIEVADIEPLLIRERMPAAAQSGERRALLDASFDGTRLDDLATQVVVRRVQIHGGNKRKAAETLGIDRGTLYRHLRSAGIDTSREGGPR
ncbi:MAG: sigma 54-interacting transcriptional regulator, partial [Deltaproteobacteria bacterium]|nr:sigma 54-interacting transcriptional regulator [Deltaproteobacteria bacterium]